MTSDVLRLYGHYFKAAIFMTVLAVSYLTVAAPTYFAPTSLISFRMRQADGVFREFDYGSESTYGVVGAHGWRGTVKGNRATLTSGRDTESSWMYRFVDGHLKELVRDEERLTVGPTEPPPTDESVQVLWPDGQRGSRNDERFFDVWRDVGRFRLGYTNPNRTALLLVELGLLCLAMTSSHRRVVVLSGVGAAAVAFALTVLTGSRTGVLAFAGAVAVWALFRYRQRLFRGRRALVAVATVVLAGACVFGFGGERLTSRLFRLDGARRNVASAAPRMMVDAPDGWGDYATGGYMTGSGKAYYDWYQPSREYAMSLTLVSDHLTQLVRFGWVGRYGYLFGWTALVLVLAFGAWRRVSPLPLALWLAFLVCTGFNRVIGGWTLWLVPCGATLWLAPALVRAVRVRGLAAALAAALLLSGAGVWTLYRLGERPYDAEVPVRYAARQVRVKSVLNPDRWLVDDGTVFGGGFFSKEMRLYYKTHPEAPGLGYVRNVFDLPKDSRKLILGGRAGWDFLMGLNDGKFPADFKVPEKILFVSPPFPPSAIPELLLRNASVQLVAGEFAAAYFDEYRTPPAWVTVVPGAELYIPDWMEMVTEM